MSSEIGQPYIWVVHPLRESWKRTLFLLTLIFLILLSIHHTFRSFHTTLLSFIFLVTPQHNFFIPCTYKIDRASISVISLLYRQTKPWKDFKTFYVDRNGILLSPFAKPSRLESFRGFYLRFNRQNRSELIEIIEEKMSEAING